MNSMIWKYVVNQTLCKEKWLNGLSDQGKMSAVRWLYWSPWDWKRFQKGFFKALGLHYSIVREIYKLNAQIQQRYYSRPARSERRSRTLKQCAVNFMLNFRSKLVRQWFFGSVKFKKKKFYYTVCSSYRPWSYGFCEEQWKLKRF